MPWRLTLSTVGLALWWPGVVGIAQSSPPQETDASRRLRIEVPAPVPPPLDVAPSPSAFRGLRTVATCPTCPTDDDRAPVTGDIAPWRLGAFYTIGNPFNHVTFGLVGQRNERLPLSMSVPIGAPIGPASPPSNANATLDTRTHWLTTIAAAKSLDNTSRGRALGVLGEAFVPLGTFAPKPASALPASPPGGAVRGAVRVLF